MARQNGLAMGHRYWFGIPVPAPSMPFPLSSLPAGGLVSTSEDMAHYLIAHLNGGRYGGPNGGTQILSSAGFDPASGRYQLDWAWAAGATVAGLVFAYLSAVCRGDIPGLKW